MASSTDIYIGIYIHSTMYTICMYYAYSFLFIFYRWRGRNRLSYLRTKSSYDSQRETSEHPLIYDDANIHFYRTHGSSNTYLIDGGRSRPIVRDLSGLSQQVIVMVNGYQVPGNGYRTNELRIPEPKVNTTQNLNFANHNLL